LIKGLKQDAGLHKNQVDELLLAGSECVRKATVQFFSEKMEAVLTAYNTAITSVFVSFNSVSIIVALILAVPIAYCLLRSEMRIVRLCSNIDHGVLGDDRN
jgi:hypothetical protein